VLVAREILDIRSPESNPAPDDDEEEREDKLAILEELERQEIKKLPGKFRCVYQP
jgi:hypothetical protein